MRGSDPSPELVKLHAKARAANQEILAKGVDLMGFWPDPESGKEIFSVRNLRPRDIAIIKDIIGPASEVVEYRGSPIETTGG